MMFDFGIVFLDDVQKWAAYGGYAMMECTVLVSCPLAHVRCAGRYQSALSTAAAEDSSLRWTFCPSHLREIATQ